MTEIEKTNICCLDLTKECIDYLKSLDLNVYEGSLGSVYSINWGRATYGAKTVLLDVNLPANLQEYHVFIHDMENPHNRDYNAEEHHIKEVDSANNRHLECRYPVNTLDLRPFGLNSIANSFRKNSIHKRIEILFVGCESVVTYQSNIVSGYDPETLGTYSNIEGWNLVSDKEKYGKRVQLENNDLSKFLFEGRLSNVRYYREFLLPTKYEDGERVADKNYISLLKNEDGGCVSYLYFNSDNFFKFVLPQVENKVGLLKDLFEKILFKYCSDYFPDVEARNWIYSDSYLLPEELNIQRKIESKREVLEKEIEKLEEEASTIQEKNKYLKQLLTETGGTLVAAVKLFLEWIGFEGVIDKDETLEEGKLKEEDLCFEYKGIHVLVEVKGINGTSTDSECSQIDKIVSRRMRQLRSTDVHGIYIVNNQKNIEPLKRQTPPFNETQIKDAKGQSRTMVYTAQLFSLYSDVDNGYISKEKARESFMEPGLANFHSELTSLGAPYDYFKKDTVVCLELNDVMVKVGDLLYYKDELDKLVGCRIENIEENNLSLESVANGKVGIKLDRKMPRNREMFVRNGTTEGRSDGMKLKDGVKK